MAAGTMPASRAQELPAWGWWVGGAIPQPPWVPPDPCVRLQPGGGYSVPERAGPG